MTTVTPDIPRFLTEFRGGFAGILTWEQLTAFWDTVRAKADAGWYVYAIGQPVPDQPRAGAEVRKFVDEIDTLLRQEHDEDYCGIVYADSKAEPRFVKIFDPHNLGTSCGSSKNPPLPAWILSLSPPCALESTQVLPANRRRFWERLWG
jgi:hypothetical protein